MTEEFNGSIDVVRGSSEDRAEEILRFWAAEAGFEGDAARARLPDVVCVLSDGAGEVAGVNSVYPENLKLIGGRRFWIYRSLLSPAAKSAGPEMVKAAFAALEEEFDPEEEGPIGLCLAIEDRAEMKRRPEAEWSDPRMLYAGYLADGRQLRIGYFDGAKI